MTTTRRSFLAGASLAAIASLTSRSSAALPGEIRFDRGFLVALARDRADRVYGPAIVTEKGKPLDYDQYRAVVFRPDRALWKADKLPFAADFFHAGGYFQKKVTLNEVVDGTTRAIAYDKEKFDFFGDFFSDPGLQIPEGYAGFRLHTHLNDPDTLSEFAVFQGASYFRSIARGQHYGLSARGIAVDTATAGRQEEFPDFTNFWLERPMPGADHVVVHALLDGPSVTGAYSFKIFPGDETRMEVEATLFPRRDIAQLGIAPLTSMYFFGGFQNRGFDDFRPAVHDSEALVIDTAGGDRIWRSLSNPEQIKLSFVEAKNPKGFGLVQRNRTFETYLDTEAKYEARPSLWIEPKNEWGDGHILLMELPVADETSDNIVATWVPDAPVKAGSRFDFSYAMTWGTDAPDRPLAKVVHVRSGRGGFANEQTSEFRKFVVDFAAAGLPTQGLKADIVVSNGTNKDGFIGTNVDLGICRVAFDVEKTGQGPVELACTIRDPEGRALSETWRYQI
jgi:glucans biosynthesis protein